MLEISEQHGAQERAQGDQFDDMTFGPLAPLVASMSEAEVEALADRAEAFLRGLRPQCTGDAARPG